MSGDSNNISKILLRKLPKNYTTVGPEAWLRIYAYGVIFVIAFIGNLFVLISVSRRFRLKSSPMNKLLLHLCLADLTVTFLYVGVEILWRISIGWYVGDFLCKLVQFFRAFGLYLSSMILICITLDRYYAVVHPLRFINGSARVRIMLLFSWVAAFVCALPQSVLFRVETHPIYSTYTQCVTLWLGETAEILNTAFSLALIYFIPLGTIIFSYGSILAVLCRRTMHSASSSARSTRSDIVPGSCQQQRTQNHFRGALLQYPHSPKQTFENRDRPEAFLCRNGTSLVARAKRRTMKLSVVIVTAFIICWTPYSIITLWHMIDRKSAEKIDVRVQDALFIFACANCCINSLLYGCFQQKRPSRAQQSTTLGYQPSISTITAANTHYCRKNIIKNCNFLTTVVVPRIETHF